MEYLAAFVSIVLVNLLLSGDNALIIALASRCLPERERKLAMIGGSVGAVVLRVVLILIAVTLLQIPYLQLASGMLLFWISIKLIAGHKTGPQHIEERKNLWDAIKTIVVADFVMSLDNVIAIIGVAKGNMLLLAAGLAVSIPLIIWGSKLIGMLISHWPGIIMVGSAFLGWTAGEMVIDDKMMDGLMGTHTWMNWGIPALFAITVIWAGRLLAEEGA